MFSINNNVLMFYLSVPTQSGIICNLYRKLIRFQLRIKPQWRLVSARRERGISIPTAAEYLGDTERMLTVTDNALDHLSKALSGSETVGENECFRFVVANDNTLSLAYESPQDDDQTFSQQGTQVLAVPASLSERLSERELDVDDNGQLVFLPKSG